MFKAGRSVNDPYNNAKCLPFASQCHRFPIIFPKFESIISLDFLESTVFQREIINTNTSWSDIAQLQYFNPAKGFRCSNISRNVLPETL